MAALSSGWFLNGSRAAAFCRNFADYIGVRHCVAVANGTDALEIAMRTLIEVRKPAGREVVTVANAGGYATIACRLLGLLPVYADIESASQLASIESVLAALSDDTALVVATHLYGGVLDVRRLRSTMDAAGYGHVPILEDCAQAHGARLDGTCVGSLGDIACFSFYPTKNLGAFGDAGAITTGDPELAEHADRLRQYGWTAKYRIDIAGGRNSRMDEVQAAILDALLPDLDAANRRRSEIVGRYASAAGSNLTVVRSPYGTVGHLAIVLSDERDAFRQHLAEAGIASDIHYPILDCDQPAWSTLPLRLSPTGLDVARAAVARIVTLPCFPSLTDDEVARTCDALARWGRR